MLCAESSASLLNERTDAAAQRTALFVRFAPAGFALAGWRLR